MQGRKVFGALVAALVVAGLLVWFTFSGGDVDAPPDEAGPAAPAVGTKGPAAAAETKKRTRAGRTWTKLGEGDVAGTVLEYGTERRLAGLPVTLTAPAPGPDTTLTTTTSADGSFRFDAVANFEDWTLRVDAPDPLADVEQAGVGVVEDKLTDLGVVYVTPAFGVPGIVVDDAGAPIEGAEVRALRSRTGMSQMDILRLIRELPVDTPAVDRAKSGKDGKFRLTKTSPGSYDFKVLAAGRQVTVERQVLVTPESEKRELRFVMSKGFALDGRLVRKGPGSVTGIPVVAFHQPRGEMDFLGLDRTYGKTDEEGKFRIDGLGSGRFVVAATPPGEPFTIADEVRIPDTTFLELTIEGDAWIEGKITGKGGSALAGAQVYVANFDRRPVVGNARTDGEGRYAIRGLKSGKVQLFLVQAEGYATWPQDLMAALQGGGSDALELKPGRNERDVSLEAGGTIRGVVVSKDDEKPIEGVRVELGTILALFGGSRGTTTDSQGRFEITGVPMGSSVLIASKDGWFQPGLNPMSIAMAFQGGNRKQADTGKGYVLSVTEPGQALERTITLARGSTLVGQVLAPDGTGVTGARVELVPEGGSGRGFNELKVLLGATDPRMSGAEGHFEMPGPPPGEKVRVLAKAAGYLDGKSDPVGASMGQRVEGITVRLRLGATVEGIVTGTDGIPIEGAQVKWIQVEGTNEWRARWDLERAKSVSTGADGRYRIEHVETGKVVVQASHAKHVSSTVRDVAVEEGKSSTVDVKLTLGGVLEGRVLGADGKPKSGATVTASFERAEGERDDDPFTEESRRMTTDSAGAFRAEGVKAGTYKVRAEAKGAAPSESATMATGGAAVTLRLAPALRIAGTVRVAGAPAPGVEVDVMRVTLDAQGLVGGTQGVGSDVTDAEGRFAVEDLPAGSYQLSLGTRSWGEGARANVISKTVPDVAAGNDAVAVEMEPGLSISGTVAMEDGAAAAAGWIWVQQIPAEGVTLTNPVSRWDQIEGGAFEVVGLVPGSYTVHVNVEGQGQKQLKLEAGAKDVKIVVGAGGKITGRVVLEDGTAASGAWVNARSGENGQSAQTDVDGRYTLSGLEAGAYRVDAGWGGGAQRRTGFVEGVDVRVGDSVEAPQITIRAAQ